MPRRPSLFTQADVTRAVRGAIAGGITVAGVQVEGGRIVVLTTAPAGRDDSGAKDAADVVAERLSHGRA